MADLNSPDTGQPMAAPVNPNISAPPAVTNVSPQPAQQANPQVQDVVHHSLLGRAVRSIMGQQVDYQVNPQTGKTEAVPVKEEPGQLFRHILAGAILGGAIGSTKKNFAQGATQGAEAVQERGREDDAQRRKQAQEDYQNQLRANEEQRAQSREQREQQTAASEEQLRKAQIAHYNAQVIRENQLIQGESYTMHDKMGEEGRAILEPFVTAGANYVFKDISESEMATLMKQNPNAAHYKWAATGVKTIIGKNGQPTYEQTYSAIDPQGKVKITPTLTKMFKEVDMDRIYPQFSDIVKPGKEMTVDQYMTLMTRYKDLKNQKDTRTKQGLDDEEKRSTIRARNAEAARAIQETEKSKKDEQRVNSFETALDNLNKNGGDLEKLSPKDKIVIGEHSSKVIDQLNGAIKEALNAFPPDQEEADRLMKQRDYYLQIQSQAIGIKPTKMIPVQIPGQPPGSIDENRWDEFLKKHPDAKRLDQPNNSAPQVTKPAPAQPAPQIAPDQYGA